MYRTVEHFHFYVSYIENFTVCIFFHLLYIFIYIYIFPRFREVDIHSCEGRNAFQKIFKCTLNNYIHPSFFKIKKRKAWNKLEMIQDAEMLEPLWMQVLVLLCQTNVEEGQH